MFVHDFLDTYVASGKVAIRHGQRSVTYARLVANIQQVAGILGAAGDPAHSRVGILLGRSIAAITAIYATLAHGSAYVPVDCDLPDERLRHILLESRVQTLLCDETSASRVRQLSLPDLRLLITVPSDTAEDVSSWGVARPANGDAPPMRLANPELAYIIFTSGSTGKPKGVMVGKPAFCAFIDEIRKAIPFYHANTVFLSLLPFHFDGSFVDLFPTLLAGGSLVLMERFLLPNQLLDRLAQERVTFTCLTSSVLRLLTGPYASVTEYALPDLEAIWYGTESCSVKIVNRVHSLWPRATLLQGYGPTEVTCTSHVHFIEHFSESTQTGYYPIGKPLRTVQAVALTDEGEIIRPGQAGRLLLGGIQMMEGYCNDPERTSAAFLDWKGSRYYQTGDYVTIDEDGNYSFAGRKDDLVKFQGKLVHLTEIEGALLRFDEIMDAIVLPDREDDAITGLTGFVAFREGASLSECAVLERLRTVLPSYMIPWRLSRVPSTVPRTPAGKLDRTQLRALVGE